MCCKKYIKDKLKSSCRTAAFDYLDSAGLNDYERELMIRHFVNRDGLFVLSGIDGFRCSYHTCSRRINLCLTKLVNYEKHLEEKTRLR